MMNNKIRIGFVLFCLLLGIGLFTSCKRKIFYEKIDPIPGEVWNIDSLLTYEINIIDSMQYYNIYIDVRNTIDFETQNLYLFMTTHFPSGEIACDTLGCVLCDPYGKWKGKGMGRIKDNQFLLKPKVRFPKKGKYKFIVQQAMREDNVKGVANFGISFYYFEKDKL